MIVFKSTGSFSAHTYSVPTTNMKGAMGTLAECEDQCFSQMDPKIRSLRMYSQSSRPASCQVELEPKFLPLQLFLMPRFTSLPIAM